MESNKDDLPKVTLRVPGPWRSFRQLIRRLPRPCRVEGNWLYVDDGPPLWLTAMPADHQFSDVFQLACRRPADKRELDGVAKYRHNAGIVGKGGSLDAARRILKVGAAVVQAGGLGVFIDNSLMAHGAGDWSDLHQHSHEPMAVYYAFVNIIRRRDGFESHGMQVMGHRDGFIDINDDDDGETSLRAFEDFLRMSCCEDRQWADHDEFYDERGRPFQLASIAEHELLADHPIVNPYGRWQIIERANRR